MTETATAITPSRMVVFYPGDREPGDTWLGAQKLSIDRAQEFDVIGGPAVIKTAYLPHPANPRKLIAFGEYGPHLAVERFNETLRVLNCLGASHITVDQLTAVRKDSKREFDFVFALGDLIDESSASWKQYYRDSGTGCDPVSPGDLRVDVLGLAAIVDAVLRRGATTAQLDLYEDQHTASSGQLAVRIKDVGLKLGRDGSTKFTQVFRVKAEFPQRRGTAAGAATL